MKKTPLERFELDVLDEAIPIQKLLRLVLVIGGRAFSEPLRNWATQELRGYDGPLGDLPTYRKIHAPLQVDSRSAFWQARGETVSALDLPGVAAETVSEEFAVRFSVSKIQALIAGQSAGKPLKVGLPGAAELARMMSYDRQSRGILVESVYWSVHASAFSDILEQVRNRLLEFVAELRSNMLPGEFEPTVEQVHRAVQNIHITVGDNSSVSVSAPVSYSVQGVKVHIPFVSRHRWWPKL
jgi:hypothetical protein